MAKQNDPGAASRPSPVPVQPSRPATERTTQDVDTSVRAAEIGMRTPSSASRGPVESEGQGIIDEAREQARTLASEAKEQTAQLAGEAKQQMSTLMAGQKQRAVDRLSALAGALREGGGKLGNDDLGSHISRYAHRAADQVESLSSYVRDAELQTFVRDTGQFARRRPEVFIGGAFLAGLLAARFLKSSSGNARRADMRMSDMSMGG